MRALFILSLLLQGCLLAACQDKGGSRSGVSTNIVDESPSYDISNQTPAQDPTLGLGNDIAAARPTSPADAKGGAPHPDMDAGTTTGAIPAGLLGRWTGVNDRCGDRSADLELTVTPKSMIFHESVGTVKGVALGANGRLKVDAAFTGEGDSWTKTLELRPSANGRELTVINDGTAVTRKRC